ncbi:hypothetical protein RND81_01G172400 [Saponaria officinalis]|uniref:FBD domain-containing protein n=1 Tax=Saponaria officinalis TaxID=3572 RepID=A0AAW1N8B7_SAPOF
MESRAKKMIPSEGEDRLSDLPDNLIVHILSFMPTLYAVKTMLLRRFGNLSTLVPTLTFDLWDYGRIIRADKEDESIDDIFTSFARFIRNVLMLHKRPTIDSFHFSMKPIPVEIKDPKLIDDVQMWLRFAIDRQVKDLNFNFNGYDDLVLPHCIFMSQSLITLTLHGCMLEHQAHVHMGTLRELSLVKVKGSGQVYNQLILGCPSLQELNINITNLSNVLNITSPSVMNVKDLPNRSLSLFKKFLRQIRNVEVVTWSCHALETLSWGRKIKFPRTKWKRLVLRPSWDVKRSIEVILELLKNSVKLEELILYYDLSPWQDDSGYGCVESSTTSTYVMPQLKKVTIHRWARFSKAQLQLVEIVLQNAVHLEQLVIRGNNSRTTVDQLNFVKQVSNFRRGSANATVIFD